MAESYVRALERRWRQTGDLQDEILYLREQVRAGLVPSKSLQLAAHCGHAASLQALQQAAHQLTVRQWYIRLQDWGRRPIVAAGFYAAAWIVNRWSLAHDRPPQLDRTLNEILAWLRRDGSISEAHALYSSLEVPCAMEIGGLEEDFGLDEAPRLRALDCALRSLSPRADSLTYSMNCAWQAAYVAAGGDLQVPARDVVSQLGPTVDATFARDYAAPDLEIVFAEVRQRLAQFSLGRGELSSQ